MTKAQIPSRIPMPCPFGGFGSTNITEIESTSGNNVNFVDGFPSAYGAPSSNNGKFVTRKEMNAIGNLASRDLFYHKCGGLNTFDPQFCAAIGGYPKGAVLQCPVANQIFEVMSLVENNTIDFTNSNSGVSGITNGSVDGINWVYCNKEIPTTGKVLLSSGSTPLSSSATTLDIIEVPASGYIVGNIGLEYGSDQDDDNCKGYNTGGVLIGGGIFVKKITNAEATNLTISNINTWTCVAQASQSGILKATHVSGQTYTYFLSLFPPTGYAGGPASTSNDPIFGSIKVIAGDVIAIAGFASDYVGRYTVPGSTAITYFAKLINPGSSKHYSGYSVELSII